LAAQEVKSVKNQKPNLKCTYPTGTLMDVRMIFQYAIKGNASGIIIAHNHPSGNNNPSESDQKITQKIKEAGNLLDIQLLDHIIITPESEIFRSFADEGQL